MTSQTISRASALARVSVGLAATLPLFAACSGAWGQAATIAPTQTVSNSGPLTAYAGSDGSVSLRRGESETVIARVTPALFESGWQFRAASFDKAANQTVIRATNANAVVRVEPKAIQADGRTLRFEYVLTPDKDVAVNSVHVAVSTPVGLFVGGTVTANGKTVPVPAQSGATHLIPSATGDTVLEKGALRLVIHPTGTTPLLVQDNRAFNGGDLEVRVGGGGERVWKAGQAETFAFTLELPQAVTVVRDAPLTLTAGTDWVPLPLKLDVEPGSALDFSNLLDAPAGKYGRIITTSAGHFAFEKRAAPQRFYGANLAFSANFLSHEEADKLAERFARIGYNTVRIHHYEGELIDTNAPNSVTLRPDSLDKLDYLIAAFKKRGVYVTTDLFVSRPVKPVEMGLTEGGADEFKVAVLVSPPALENWKAFSRVVLNHVNPYTGLAYKDEPALAWLSVVNEPNLTNMLGRLNGKLDELVTTEWRTWLAQQYSTDAALASAWGETSATRAAAALPRSIENNRRGRDTGAFLAFLHARGYERMKGFLRNEIGTKALLTDLNGWSETPAFMANRASLDFVDNHFYWDHPNFLEKSWSLPSEGGSGGGGAVQSTGAGPSFIAMTRIFGKPFTVSEFNYSAPNRYRAEGGMLMGAAAALQDWDAVWRFAYSHSREAVSGPQPLDYFNMATDPAGMAGERAALALFLRGDIRPAPDSMARVLRPENALNGESVVPGPDLGALTLTLRVGSRTMPPSTFTIPGQAGVGATGLVPVREPVALQTTARTLNPRATNITLANGPGTSLITPQDAYNTARESILPKTNRTDLATGRRESETGEIFVDGEAGQMIINAPRTVGVVAPTGANVSAGPLTVLVGGTRAAVWASSLDNKPVRESSRLLLVHLTDVQNANMTYAGPDRRVLTAWGTLPHLARRGTAQITLTHAQPGTLKAWRLDTSGKRVTTIPVRVANGKAILDLSTAASDGTATLYYEIATK